MTTRTMPRGTWGRKFIPLFLVGLIGVASLVPFMVQQSTTLPGVEPGMIPLIVGAALVQTSLLLAIAVAVGIILAPRLGLRSHLAARFAEGEPLLPALRSDLPQAISLGLIGAVLMLGSDLLFRPFMRDAMAALEQTMPHATLSVTLMGLLYGGITEELLVRWGVMSVLAWIGWRLTQRGQGLPRPAVMWVAIVLAAIVFGALHLPATAAVTALTPVVVVRGIVINSIGGIFFGWLFWRRSLEAAMIAHAMFHVVSTIVSLILVWVR